MPQDVDPKPEEKQKPVRPTAKPKGTFRQWFTTPKPIKRLFDRFPLQTYSANELPQRTAAHRNQHALYIFTTEQGARHGAPSFNPGCLKWQVNNTLGFNNDRRIHKLIADLRQAYLRFMDFTFVTIPSNNHASPSGALPFLLPSASSSTSNTEDAIPVPSNRIQRWTREMKSPRRNSGKAPFIAYSDEGEQTENGAQATKAQKAKLAREDPAVMRYEAYMSLLDLRIRNAYVRDRFHFSSSLY